MGLEKLKSVFKEGFEDKSSTTNLADMVSEFGTPIGGLFNQSEKYSISFRTINTPTFEDIIDSGNIKTNGGGILIYLDCWKDFQNQNQRVI